MAPQLNLVGVAGCVMALAALIVAITAATFAGLSARHARDSAVRAKEANADQLGPSIRIEVASGRFRGRCTPRVELNLSDESQIIIGAIRNFAENEWSPQQTFVNPGQASMFLACRTSLHIKNEGHRTAVVFVGAQFVGLRSVWKGSPIQRSYVAPLDEGEIVVAPGSEEEVVVYSGYTIGEWFELGKPLESDFEHSISAWVEPDGARQNWKLRVRAAMLQPSLENDSGARLVPAIPPTAKVEVLNRTYPPRK